MEEKEKKNVEKPKKDAPKEKSTKETTKTSQPKKETNPETVVKKETKPKAKPVAEVTDKKESAKVEPKKEEPVKKEAPKKVEVKTKTENKTGKTVAIIAVILIICLVIGSVIVYSNMKETQVLTDSQKVNVTITYPSTKGYIYENEETGQKTAVIKKENGDFLVKVKIDTSSLGYWYSGDFNKYKEGKQGKDITINGVKGFSYFYAEESRYTIVLPVDEKTTIEIDVLPLKENLNGQDIYNRDEIRNIIESIKIENL